MRSAAAALLALVALLPRAAGAVGLEGAAAADCRFGAGLGLGWDQVAGVGRDGYPFFELFGHGERRWASGLVLGAGASVRRDVASYSFALEGFRGGATGLGLQITVGFESPRFHLSLGPALVGEGRRSGHFDVGLLPVGALRLRVGSQDGWNVGLRILEAVPAAAGGGAIAVRADLGLPAQGRHRWRFGLYGSIAEATFGVSASDEIPTDRLGPAIRALRGACLLGTDISHATRAELTCSLGVLF